MTERQKYFVKQKLIGIAMLLLTAVSWIVLDGDATIGILYVPIGIYLIFTKKMWVMDDYFLQIEERKE